MWAKEPKLACITLDMFTHVASSPALSVVHVANHSPNESNRHRRPLRVYACGRRRERVRVGVGVGVGVFESGYERERERKRVRACVCGGRGFETAQRTQRPRSRQCGLDGRADMCGEGKPVSANMQQRGLPRGL